MNKEDVADYLSAEVRIQELISSAVNELAGSALAEAPNIILERPKDESHGDYATNVAMRFAKHFRLKPVDAANRIKTIMESSESCTGFIQSVNVAGPGFINIQLTQQVLSGVLKEVYSKKEDFGSGTKVQGRRILLEYVSANPTGPLTIAHGRQAAYGDSLKRILKFAGFNVESEYYNNDVGVQISILGHSVFARCMEIQGVNYEFPEEGYKGEYIKDIAAKLLEQNPGAVSGQDKGRSIVECASFAREFIFDIIKKDLDDFNVYFDCYYSQEKLDKSGKVEEALKALEANGNVYESEGAKWLKSTDYGDDKDRVVVKSDGLFTYLMPDIAYHNDKFRRGYTDIVDILGPDHHGYIKRLKASQAALGYDPDRVTVLIAQLVSLYEGEKQLKMSTRAGEFITLRQLIDEVGVDAARFFFLMRKCDSHLEFDLELAKKQSSDNPVFYIQYAHARISNFRRVFSEKGIAISEKADLSLLNTDEDTALLRHLRRFHKSITLAAENMDPHPVIEYLQQLAARFHHYYQKNTIAVTDDHALASARLLLAESVQQVIRNGLSLLGVSAPESM